MQLPSRGILIQLADRYGTGHQPAVLSWEPGGVRRPLMHQDATPRIPAQHHGHPVEPAPPNRLSTLDDAYDSVTLIHPLHQFAHDTHPVVSILEAFPVNLSDADFRVSARRRCPRHCLGRRAADTMVAGARPPWDQVLLEVLTVGRILCLALTGWPLF